jgi:hypothetical protein
MDRRAHRRRDCRPRHHRPAGLDHQAFAEEERRPTGCCHHARRAATIGAGGKVCRCVAESHRFPAIACPAVYITQTLAVDLLCRVTCHSGFIAADGISWE